MTDLHEQSNLQYQGLIVHRQPDTGLVCLTDMWKAQCSPAKKRPLAWVHLDTTQELLKRLVNQTGAVPVWSERKLKDRSSKQVINEILGILEISREDKASRTYSTVELAVIYARFLSVECYEWSLTALVEESEQEAALLEQIEQELNSERQKQFSRRALIATGWVVPVTLSVGLANIAQAQVSCPNNSSSLTAQVSCHNDHNDHNDHCDHGDSPHGDDNVRLPDNNTPIHIDYPHIDRAC